MRVLVPLLAFVFTLGCGGMEQQPAVQATHAPMDALVDNAFGYINPANGLFDSLSGYPYEGWNDEPKRGLFLRDFTQITAIGEWVELLANITAGQAKNPFVTPADALVRLEDLVATLRQDQHDPLLSSMGLLVNFLGIEGDKRIGPLAQSVLRQNFLDAFGAEQGGRIWDALVAATWLKPQNKGKEGLVLRSATYGAAHFSGPLEPFADASAVTRIMEILDARVVLVAYGDNANLSTSVAKAIGALLAPEIADNPTAKELGAELNRFLDDQAAGYASLVDEDVQMLSFGRDETTGKFFGWNDDDDNWVVGHQDYLVNEFRDPTMLIVARFGLPEALLRNLGFKIRSYDTVDSRCLFTLVPYEGSAFQSFGLDLGMPLMDHPVWSIILENAVDIHLDYAKRNSLPGFLSESYSGKGTDYTGRLGLPELAVTTEPREVHAPSLYTLGTAYQIAPAKVNAFVHSHEAVIRSLFTEHGPWEGYQVERQEAIEFQTTAHTLSLILGALGHGPENMRRYLAAEGLSDRVQQLYHHGTAIDLLGPGMGITPWATDGAAISATREGESLAIRSESAGMAGVVFTMPEGKPQSLAGGILQIRYQAARAVNNVRIVPKGPNPLPRKVIPIDIQTRFAITGLEPGLLRIPLPPTASLSDVLKIELNLQGEGPEKPQIFILREFSFTPMPPDSR